MMCNKCGMQNSEGSKFCIGCGNNLEVLSNSMISDNEINQSLENNVGMQNFSNTQSNPTQNFNNNSFQDLNNNIGVNNSVNNMQSNITESKNVPVVNIGNNKKEKKSINKKLLFIIGGALIVIVAIVLLLSIILKGDNSSKNLSSIFDLEQPIPVYKDGMYVYIDTNGKIIKNVKYNEASDFNGDYAFVELEDGTAALIDKSQNIKVKATSYYGMEYLSEYDLWLIDGVLYNSKLKAITDKSINLEYKEYGFFTYNNTDYTEYGIINSEGKKIYKNNCLITSLDVSDDSYENEYYGILKTTCIENEQETKNEYLIELQTGKILYENEYKKQNPDSYYYYLSETSDNMFYIYDNNYDKIKFIYLKDNKIVYESTEVLYDLELYGDKYLELDFGYDYEGQGKEQRYYYYNLETKKLEEDEPELEEVDIKIEKDIASRQIVSCSNGKGLIDDKKVIIPCIYNDIEYLNENVHEYMKQVKSMDLMVVEDDEGNLSIYDANDRKEIIKFEDSKKSSIEDYKSSLLIQQKIYVNDSWYSDLDKRVVHNLLTREKITFDKNSSIEIKSNYFIESKNGKKFYYNMNLEKIYTEN